MLIPKNILIFILSVSLMISSGLGIITSRNNKQNNHNSRVYNYEITTNGDEIISERGTSYNIDKMGNLTIKFNDEQSATFSYGCWTKIMEAEVKDAPEENWRNKP